MKHTCVLTIGGRRHYLHKNPPGFQEIKKAFLIALRIPALKESVIQMKLVLKEAEKYREINTPKISANTKAIKFLAQAQKGCN